MATVGEQIRGGVTGNAFGINQTSFLFGALVLAFLFFITVKGDLPAWLGLLGLGGGVTPANASASQSSVPSSIIGNNNPTILSNDVTAGQDSLNSPAQLQQNWNMVTQAPSSIWNWLTSPASAQ